MSEKSPPANVGYQSEVVKGTMATSEKLGYFLKLPAISSYLSADDRKPGIMSTRFFLFSSAVPAACGDDTAVGTTHRTRRDFARAALLYACRRALGAAAKHAVAAATMAWWSENGWHPKSLFLPIFLIDRLQTARGLSHNEARGAAVRRSVSDDGAFLHELVLRHSRHARAVAKERQDPVPGRFAFERPS